MIRFRLTCILVAAVLTACGGGGSGGNGGDTGVGTATNLVPAAPALGATLHAHAAELRPLIDGAQWQYRGVQNTSDGSAPVRYTASTSQKLVGGNLQETDNGVFLAGEASGVVALHGGSVVVQVKDPLGIGSSEVMSVTELRSPVRVNDQYTHYERRDVSTGTDIDGDGKTDVADVAAYTRVIGNESVELPELARALTAVKVETTVRARVKKSSDDTTLPVTTLVEARWYVAGVGVVRRSLRWDTAPSGASLPAYDERLFSWDGVTKGLGALGPTPATVPNASSSQLLPDTLAAATVGDQGLVLANSLQAGDPDALTFAVFDKRGMLQSVTPVPGLGSGRFAFGSPSLFGIDGNTALLVMPVGTGPGVLKLQRVDASGATKGAASTVTLPTNNSNVRFAWDGQALWVAWHSSAMQPGDWGNLMLQPFSSDGQPLAGPRVMAAPALGDQIGGVGLSAAAGRVLLSWAHSQGHAVTYRYALVQGADGAQTVHTLGTVQRFSSSQPPVVPVLGSGIAVLQWSGPVFSYTGSDALPDLLPRGVVLDASGNPRRSNVGGLDDERLPSNWVGNNTPVLAQALGDRLVVSSFDYQRAAPQLTNPTDVVLTAFVQPGSQPLVTAAASATSLATASGSLTNIDQFGLPAFVLLWDDRALVIGNNAGRTMTSVFWLR